MEETRGDLCNAIWEHLISVHAGEVNYGVASKLPYRWRKLPHMRLVVVQYLSLATNQAGVFIRGEKGVPFTTVCKRLQPFAQVLRKALRRDMGSEYLFCSRKSLSIHDRSQWDLIANWLHKKADAYQGALQRSIGKGDLQAFRMPDDPIRTAIIEANFAPETLDAIRRAAEIQGRSVGDFVVAAIEQATARTIQLANVIMLSTEDQRAFAEAILNPPEPVPALRGDRTRR